MPNITFTVGESTYRKILEIQDLTGLGVSHVLQDWLELTDPGPGEIMNLRRQKIAARRLSQTKRKVKPL